MSSPCIIHTHTYIHTHTHKHTHTHAHTHIQGSELIMKHVSPPSDKINSPVVAFIALERYNAIRLVQTVHSSLAALNKVLKGTSLLTPSVQKLAGALLKHEVHMSTKVSLLQAERALCCMHIQLVQRSLYVSNVCLSVLTSAKLCHCVTMPLYS